MALTMPKKNRPQKKRVKAPEKFSGTHLVIDLFGAEGLNSVLDVEKILKKCVDKCGAKLLYSHMHYLAENLGACGVLVLAGGHISIHSCPDTGYAALDIFMSGAAKPKKAIPIIKKEFKCQSMEFHMVERGPQ
jgi:S-adenosylmethionine decarboxylase